MIAILFRESDFFSFGFEFILLKKKLIIFLQTLFLKLNP